MQALVTAACEVKDRLGIPIVALDIAGAERGFPAVAHAEAYRYAHKRFMNKTVHAGEGYGPESIFQAITDLNAERIGHGFHLFHEDMIEHPDKLIMSPSKYASSTAIHLLLWCDMFSATIIMHIATQHRSVHAYMDARAKFTKVICAQKQRI